MNRLYSVKTLLISVMLCQVSYAGLDRQIQSLLAGGQPDGIVFEIVTGNSNALDTSLPRVRQAVTSLRSKWPGLDIIIVSHGKEQFALTKDNSVRHRATQKQVRDLTSLDKVDFHVCGAYANMHNVSEEEFPEYINVSAHGPEQIRDYQALGYIVIQVD